MLFLYWCCCLWSHRKHLPSLRTLHLLFLVYFLSVTALSLSFFLCYGFIFTFFHRAFALEHSPERKRATKKGLKREYERNKNKTTDDDEDRASYTRVWQHISLLLIIKSGIRDQPHKMEAKALALYSLSLLLH